jgi:hypothetical protein
MGVFIASQLLNEPAMATDLAWGMFSLNSVGLLPLPGCAGVSFLAEAALGARVPAGATVLPAGVI